MNYKIIIYAYFELLDVLVEELDVLVEVGDVHLWGDIGKDFGLDFIQRDIVGGRYFDGLEVSLVLHDFHQSMIKLLYIKSLNKATFSSVP